LCWTTWKRFRYERVFPKTTITNHSRIGRGITKDILQDIKKLHMTIPCPRETWPHLLNPLRTQWKRKQSPHEHPGKTQPTLTSHSNCTLETPREHDEPALEEAHVTERSRPQGVDIITFDSDPDLDIDEIHRKWQAKAADNLDSYVHFTLAYFPSPGTVNQLVARVNP
jgi:hypothetical protein